MCRPTADSSPLPQEKLEVGVSTVRGQVRVVWNQLNHDYPVAVSINTLSTGASCNAEMLSLDFTLFLPNSFSDRLGALSSPGRPQRSRLQNRSFHLRPWAQGSDHPVSVSGDPVSGLEGGGGRRKWGATFLMQHFNVLGWKHEQKKSMHICMSPTLFFLISISCNC